MEQAQIDFAKSFMDKSRIYFIEKYFMTFNATAGKNTQFALFPRQKVFLNNISNHSKNIAIKHRQCGITTVSSAWAAAQCVFAPADAPETILCIGNKLDLAQQLIIKIRDFLNQVPRWYWGDDYYSTDPKSEKNKKDIFTKNSKSELELFNGCKVYARSSSANAARGISAVSILIFDEAAFIEDGLAVYTSAVAATASNPNRKIIMVSTPNGKDELYYNTYKQALSKENGYIATEFKWYQDLRYNKSLQWYRKNPENGDMEWDVDSVLDKTGTVKYDEERWKRLEKAGWKPTSPWYTAMCQSFNNDSMKIAQELDVSFMGSANNVVDPEFIEMQEKLNVMDPLEDMKDPMVEETWFWKAPIDGHRYICACLPHGEKVLTLNGLVNVENVDKDDLLVTKEGEYTKIKHRKYREVDNEKMIKITLCNTYDEFNCTWNHPIWASNESKNKRTFYYDDNNKRRCHKKWFHKFDFLDAEKLTKGSWVEMPNIYYINKLDENDMLKYWDNYEIVGSKKHSNIKCPLLDEDFWWYCGMWLAEGYVIKDKFGNYKFSTVHHLNETNYHNKINELSKRLFNRKATTIKNTKTNVCKITIYSKQISKFLNDNFGKYAHGKYISEWIKKIPNKFKIKLLEGYFNGDGYIAPNYMGAESVSLQLLKDIQDILFSLGISCSIRKKRDGQSGVCIVNRIVNTKDCFSILLGETATWKFHQMLGKETTAKLSNNAQKKSLYFSDDLSKIYIKIKNIEEYNYNGKVYNFETLNESHTFCGRNVATHNCDPSRGVSSDCTAIEIIDIDGRDEDGMPIVEQVAEYLGKKLGDDIGGLLYQYATLYNNAHIIIDCTGGCGDSAALALINMGYTNLYYEDSSQKTYTLQNSTKISTDYNNRLPGFHFQGNRYPVLSNFAGMIRNNEFKVRSIRVINELETWIFKGEAGRIDHMTGSHDDTLTCLAMALFVMQYSLHKQEQAKTKDAAILGAYMIGGGTSSSKPRDRMGMTPTVSAPLYSGRQLNKYSSNAQGNYLWLFSRK